MHLVFPDRPIEDLKNQDEIFHVFYDLDDRVQIPGTRFIWGRRQYTPDSANPAWLQGNHLNVDYVIEEDQLTKESRSHTPVTSA